MCVSAILCTQPPNLLFGSMCYLWCCRMSVVVCAFVLVAAFAPWIAPYDPLAQSYLRIKRGFVGMTIQRPSSTARARHYHHSSSPTSSSWSPLRGRPHIEQSVGLVRKPARPQAWKLCAEGVHACACMHHAHDMGSRQGLCSSLFGHGALNIAPYALALQCCRLTLPRTYS